MTPPSKWLFFPTQSSGGGGNNWTDYMSDESGTDYWIVTAGSAGTGETTRTGGDGSATWTKVRAVGTAGGGTTQSGNTISFPPNKWKRGIQGGHAQLSNTYDYLAVGWETAGSGGYGQANSAGWVILEREQTAGSITSNRQSYIPIDGTDGLTESSWTGLPAWNAASYGDHILFFFDGYTSGHVDDWTAWDGSTTP